ncbi:cation:proton antiporter [Rhodopirellula sp. JC639]|uniref:cation:proton antiporter n=1 Tax=Stieleria mannarensis TaxID=2755585 RepID=UPI001C72523B|nr:cation:proton antiporter [Rhodopirellula sp. JC639]
MSLVAEVAPTNHSEADGLIVVGLFLLAGFAAHVLGKRVHVPRITLLLLLGFLAGPSALDLIPSKASDWFPLATELALSMIGFQLGERFLGKKLRETGKIVLSISLVDVFLAVIIVFVCLVAVQTPLAIALLMASLAPATAPAATVDVVRESDAKGPVSDTALGVVAIDDAWGVMLFSILLLVAQALTGQNASGAIVLDGVREVGGGVLLGVVLGLPMAWLTGRIRPGELTLVEAIGFVLLCAGIAMRFELSYVLACMAMGATVSNLATHHERPFHSIEQVEQPFLITFFLLAGFQFHVASIGTMGLAGVTYILARSLGRLAGGYLGSRLGRAPSVVATHIGWCLLPQAGVALGLGLIVAERFPELGSQVLSTVIGTTIVFEVIGPIATRCALRHAGEIPEP